MTGGVQGMGRAEEDDEMEGENKEKEQEWRKGKQQADEEEEEEEEEQEQEEGAKCYHRGLNDAHVHRAPAMIQDGKHVCIQGIMPTHED